MTKHVPVDMDSLIYAARQALAGPAEGQLAAEMEQVLGVEASNLEQQGFPEQAARLREWARKVHAYRNGQPYSDGDE